jgi:hypothetical protein
MRTWSWTSTTVFVEYVLDDGFREGVLANPAGKSYERLLRKLLIQKKPQTEASSGADAGACTAVHSMPAVCCRCECWHCQGSKLHRPEGVPLP